MTVYMMASSLSCLEKIVLRLIEGKVPILDIVSFSGVRVSTFSSVSLIARAVTSSAVISSFIILRLGLFNFTLFSAIWKDHS